MSTLAHIDTTSMDPSVDESIVDGSSESSTISAENKTETLTSPTATSASITSKSKSRSSSIFSLNTPTLKLSNLAAKLDRNFGIAKQWTLQKLGASKGTIENPELVAAIQRFNTDSDDITKLKHGLEQLVKVEEGLIQSWEKLAAHFLHLSAPVPNIGELKENNKVLLVEDEIERRKNSASEQGDSSDPSTAALSAPLAMANALQAFSGILRQDINSYTEFGIERLDALIDSSIELNERLIHSLNTMRLDADAKADTLISKRSRVSAEEASEYEKVAETTASAYGAQCEVVEKLCNQVRIQKGELMERVVDDYSKTVRESYERIAERLQITEEEAQRKDFAIYFAQHGIHNTESDEDESKAGHHTRIESL